MPVKGIQKCTDIPAALLWLQLLFDTQGGVRRLCGEKGERKREKHPSGWQRNPVQGDSLAWRGLSGWDTPSWGEHCSHWCHFSPWHLSGDPSQLLGTAVLLGDTKSCLIISSLPVPPQEPSGCGQWCPAEAPAP